jgi:hypothetical protein
MQALPLFIARVFCALHIIFAINDGARFAESQFTDSFIGAWVIVITGSTGSRVMLTTGDGIAKICSAWIVIVTIAGGAKTDSFLGTLVIDRAGITVIAGLSRFREILAASPVIGRCCDAAIMGADVTIITFHQGS